MDATTGQVLTQGNADERRNPASLTKLMTGYVVDRAIDSKRISRDDWVTVGKDAWAAGNPVFQGSSLMFLKPGEKVFVRDLSRGVNIDSGNDACVALADYVAGSQAAFVDRMNHYVEKLGLTNTHFETVHGLDAPGQYTTAGDLAKLSRAIIYGEPDFYQMYGEKSLSGTVSPSRIVTVCDGTKCCTLTDLKPAIPKAQALILLLQALTGSVA